MEPSQIGHATLNVLPAVLALDVGFRAGGWVLLDERMGFTWGVTQTQAPPSRKVRVPGELAAHDDATIGQSYQDLVDMIVGRGRLRGIVYEVPGGMQGARALETMAFARTVIVCAARHAGIPIARVTPVESDRQVNGPPAPRPSPMRAPGRGASAAEVDRYTAEVKARKRAKDEARKNRKIQTADAMEAAFPALRGIRTKVAGWSHVCDAAAALVAEATVGTAIRTWMAPRESNAPDVAALLVEIGVTSRARRPPA